MRCCDRAMQEHTVPTAESFSGDAGVLQPNFSTGSKIFAHLLDLLRAAEATVPRGRGGRPRKLSLEEALAMTLERVRRGPSIEKLARQSGVAISTAHQTIVEVRRVLAKELVALQGQPGGTCAASGV